MHFRTPPVPPQALCLSSNAANFWQCVGILRPTNAQGSIVPGGPGMVSGEGSPPEQACIRSEGAQSAIRSDVWQQSCSDRAKNILAWLKTIPTAVCGCNPTASKSPMTLRCSSRPTNQLEVVVTRWFGALEGTWALNLLVLRPSLADTMPRRDSAESSGAFWPFCAIARRRQGLEQNPLASGVRGCGRGS